MPKAAFSTAIDDRYFEDYLPGSIYEFGPIKVEKAELIAFAERFDPQRIHTDPVAAAAGPFKGLISSGWYTVALLMRLTVDNFLSSVAGIASPGIDELRWIVPVRPSDELTLRIAITEATPSRSKPDRGMVRCFIEGLNQDGVVVCSFKSMNLLFKRPA
jgi:acyl dehydratase